jgi:hypothetical protein
VSQDYKLQVLKDIRCSLATKFTYKNRSGGKRDVESGTCPAQTNIEKRRRKKGFFHASVSPNPLSITLGPFQIFSKIHGDNRSSRFNVGVIETSGNWKKSSIRNI